MDIRRCYEVLELESDASEEQVRQAYKDMVNVWHPDRFANNPRLRQKAEEKLKEANIAYDTVRSFISSKKAGGGTTQGAEAARERPPEEKRAEPSEKEKARGPMEGVRRPRPPGRDRTEVIAETGTRIFLNLCSYLYSTVRDFIGTEISEGEPRSPRAQQGPGDRPPWGGGPMRGRGKGRGMGRGKGMGRGRGRRP